MLLNEGGGGSSDEKDTVSGPDATDTPTVPLNEEAVRAAADDAAALVRKHGRPVDASMREAVVAGVLALLFALNAKK